MYRYLLLHRKIIAHQSTDSTSEGHFVEAHGWMVVSRNDALYSHQVIFEASLSNMLFYSSFPVLSLLIYCGTPVIPWQHTELLNS